MLRRHEIKDQDWERIQDVLPPENTGEGRPSKPNRVMLNGMLWKVKTGAPWRDLPERFGPWKTVYSRFRLWSNDDLFKRSSIKISFQTRPSTLTESNSRIRFALKRTIKSSN